MIRARTLTTFRTDDEAANRFQEHVKEVLNPVLKQIAGSPAWISVGGSDGPAFQNGWTNFAVPGNAAAQFYRDVLGMVHLRGMVKGGTVGATVFALPDGYRPAAAFNFACVSNNLFGQGVVFPDGRVVASSGSNAYFDFGNQVFPAEA